MTGIPEALTLAYVEMATFAEYDATFWNQCVHVLLGCIWCLQLTGLLTQHTRTC